MWIKPIWILMDPEVVFQELWSCFYGMKFTWDLCIFVTAYLASSPGRGVNRGSPGQVEESRLTLIRSNLWTGVHAQRSSKTRTHASDKQNIMLINWIWSRHFCPLSYFTLALISWRFNSKCQKLSDISFYGHVWLRRGPNSSGSVTQGKSFKLQLLYTPVSSYYYQSMTIKASDTGMEVSF